MNQPIEAKGPELLPCPFCHGEIELIGADSVWHKHKEGFLCPIGNFGIPLHQWNHRSDVASPKPVVSDEVKRAVDSLQRYVPDIEDEKGGWKSATMRATKAKSSGYFMAEKVEPLLSSLLAEHDSLLAAAPKVWTAKTIGDAPQSNFDYYSLWDEHASVWCTPRHWMDVAALILHKHEIVRSAWPKCFGPFSIPQPLPTDTEGRVG